MVRKDLGMVTAYAYAVSKGYTGTEAEFAELMASYASVAQEAVDAALAAAQSAQAAASARDTAQTTVAGAIAGIQAEGQTQVDNVNAAGATQIAAVEAKGRETRESIPDDYTTLANTVNSLSDEIDLIETVVKVPPGSTESAVSLPTMSLPYYWNVETTTAVKTPLDQSNWRTFDPLDVTAGQMYKVKACQGNTEKTRIWIITDDDLTIISMANNHKGTDYAEETFTVPENGTKLLVCTTASVSGGTNPYAYIWRLLPGGSAYIPDLRLSGKKLSLLGDSISAYAGTIPSGNDAYYTGSNSGVSSPDQMWWKVLCDTLDMTPLIINGYSGSGITQLEDSLHVSKVPMSSDARCSALGNGTDTPDIVLIAGGVNDYTYALSAQSEPLPWDGKTAPVQSNSFTEAYACMIKKIQANYPNAIVVALSTWFTMRGTDNGYTLTHTVGQNTYTQQDYNDKIRYVAEQMHIPYIDVSDIGFNRNNFYPTYASDSSTIPTHPNAEGQAVMGFAIANKLPDLIAGYFKS